MIRAAAPPRASDPPPPWLLPDQVASFQHVLAALRTHGGALLADPPGSGKTWVALAVAQAWAGQGGLVVIVPAALREQWQRTAAGLGLAIALHSHERLSRGRLPPGQARFVIVDESHHYRNPGTRRYRTLAPWLGRTPVLLLSATPVVNRLEDLAHQLLLAVPDDALAHRGTASLLAMLRAGQPAVALHELVIARGDRTPGRPRRQAAALATGPDPAEEALAQAIERLSCSASAPIAGLVRTVLWRALASSPGALLASLRRYRRLLLSARDALAAGRQFSRAGLRALAGPAADQLVFWQLLPADPSGSDLDLGDLERLDPLLRTAQDWAREDDHRCGRLRALLHSRERTVVFSASRDTVGWLRSRLEALGPAWCTGDAAGIGHLRLPRDRVLAWFGVTAAGPGGPRVLLSTDVAAEGLDLRAARRIVHYDLPWTGVRVDQREGRLLRRGSPHDAVEVIRFDPPPAVERRLGLLACLERKRALPAAAGLAFAASNRVRRPARWQTDLAGLDDGGPACPGVAVLAGPEPGALVALDWGPSPGGGGALLARLMPDGTVTDDAGAVAACLVSALRSEVGPRPDPAGLAAALARVRDLARDRLRMLGDAAWRPLPRAPELGRLIARLRALAAGAARRRDPRLLAQAEHAIRLAGGGLRAGEAMRLARLADLPAAALRAELAALPGPRDPPRPGVPRLLGLILVRDHRVTLAHEQGTVEPTLHPAEEER
jgi:hypothetical protein